MAASYLLVVSGSYPFCRQLHPHSSGCPVRSYRADIMAHGTAQCTILGMEPGEVSAEVSPLLGSPTRWILST